MNLITHLCYSCNLQDLNFFVLIVHSICILTTRGRRTSCGFKVTIFSHILRFQQQTLQMYTKDLKSDKKQWNSSIYLVYFNQMYLLV